MPLKLVPPRKGKTPFWSIRGTYLKVYVDRSCRTDRKALANKLKRELEGKIERGEYPEKPQQVTETFLSAAVDYMKAGGERTHMARLISHFGETPLAEIDQDAVDSAALAILPTFTPAARNRAVYTPVSAVLRYKGVTTPLRRPKGAKGKIKTDYMPPDVAFAIIGGADSFDPEFGTYLYFLLYTGARRSEPLGLMIEHLRLDHSAAIFGKTKNGEPRSMGLHPELVNRLRALVGERTTGPVFRFGKATGGFKDMLLRAKLAAEGRAVPKRTKTGPRRQPAHKFSWVTFHTFRHTWATWMRMYGGADLLGLVGTDNWKDARSAARYAHVVPRDEWNRVEKFPSATRGRDVDSEAKSA